ncbi:MAG: cyclic nucleotide-binding domain-containing protein [Polyangiaceae bacterium]
MVANADMLAEVPIFALLDEGERAALAERIEVEKHAKGSLVFRAGDPGDRLYVVRSGTVELFFKNDTGDRVVLETATAGDFFGEMSLLDGGPRMASAEVLEDLEAVVVDRGDLDHLFRVRPEAAMDMLTATGKRLRETTRLLRHSASRNANREEQDNRSWVMIAADWISAFSSLVPLHSHRALHDLDRQRSPTVGLFVRWVRSVPFGLLTMAVSLEAIILSVFVLLAEPSEQARPRSQRRRVRGQPQGRARGGAPPRDARRHERGPRGAAHQRSTERRGLGRQGAVASASSDRKDGTVSPAVTRRSGGSTNPLIFCGDRGSTEPQPRSNLRAVIAQPLSLDRDLHHHRRLRRATEKKPSGGAATDAVSTSSSALVTLTVTVEGTGGVRSEPAGIECPGQCSADFPAGTHVKLVAAPAEGWKLDAWSGGCSGAAACEVDLGTGLSVASKLALIRSALGPVVRRGRLP